MSNCSNVEIAEHRHAAMVVRAMKQKYQVIAVHHDGWTRWLGVPNAMGDGAMIAWATRHQAAFVTRFYPSQKGWLIIDVRKARRVESGNGFAKWYDAPRSTKPLPTAEAAIMKCIHMITAQLVML